MCRNGCRVNHFRMVTINIPPETAPANPENPWQKVLTDGHAPLVRARRVFRICPRRHDARCATTRLAAQPDVFSPLLASALAQESQSLQSLLRCASRGRR